MTFLLRLRLCTIALLPVLSTTTVQAAANNPDERIRQFVVERYHDTRHLIEGPQGSAPPAIAPDQSCITLYERRLTLLRQLDDYKPPYWDDPRNQAAVFIGTMWTPAFYFLGYSAVNARLEEIDDIGPQTELDALRHASAQQRCFER